MQLFMRLGNGSCITLPTHIPVLVEDEKKSCVKLVKLILLGYLSTGLLINFNESRLVNGIKRYKI